MKKSVHIVGLSHVYKSTILLKTKMAWAYRKNARHSNPKKDAVRKAVCKKTKRKTKNEMAG